ncbi:MAG: 3'-5' exonuclease [Candidatus Omnitrophica bacterium]|nr:3'-5' exonuclease [Candidatus Omnitrophota bacterium]
MKTYLFFDTETTGLPKSWKAPVTDLGNWPHIVQIAWALFDENGTQIAFRDHIIKPEGFVIPANATAIHGISTERALNEGRSAAEILKEFSEAVRGAACLIAHNLDFDEKMTRVELFRQGMPDALQGIQKICTMKGSTGYCKIPGPYGDKWPKLSELHIKLFEVDFEDQHNAASDVLCCAKCFFELRRRGIICASLNG